MKTIGIIDDSTSPTKGMEVAMPVTVLETPSISVFGIRAYHKDLTGMNCLGDVVQAQPKVAGKLGMKKESQTKTDGTKIEDFEKQIDKISRICILAITNCENAGSARKQFDTVEIAVGGEVKDQLEYAKSILGKDIAVKDAIAEGEWIDVLSVSRGKGWQGAIKRFGVWKQRRKSTGRIRHVGTLGPWHPMYTMYTARQAGQVGYHRRTQYNNRIFVVSNDPKINPAGGFPHYGIVKTDYVIVKGSVPGTQKRFVFLRKALRNTEAPKKPQVIWQ
jgi:large subunit ribosomal protein L3